MTNTFVITDNVGRVVETQTLADQYAPVLRPGAPVAVLVTAGQVLAGSFTATGAGASMTLLGAFAVTVYGAFVGSTRLECSFDGGTTWIPVSDESGGDVAFTVPGQATREQTESSVLYRMNCTAYTSGTINWKITQ